jgi:hypothetical protein
VQVVAAGEVCAFEITIEHDGTIITTMSYDRDGGAVRRLVRFGEHFTESYSANGRSLSTVSIAPEHVDLAAGEVTVTGNQRHLTVPRVGVVYATAGRYVFVFGTGEVLAFSGLDVPSPGGALRGTFALTSAGTWRQLERSRREASRPGIGLDSHPGRRNTAGDEPQRLAEHWSVVPKRESERVARHVRAR